MNLRLKYILLVAAFLSTTVAMAQVPFADATKDLPSSLPQLLDGRNICIDPGHGGHESDDRQTDVGFGLTYWESEGNFGTANYLYAQLEALGVDISITRTRNDLNSGASSDPSLSERVAFSEQQDAEFFQSIHTNGIDNNPSTNYHLMIYASLVDNNTVEQFPLAKEMSYVMSREIPKVVFTTSTSVKGDIPFSGYNNGYGILNGSTVPAVISEAAFHSNPAEGRRLKSAMYQEAMAMAMTKSYLIQFGKTGTINFGEIKGIVDHSADVDLNGVKVEAIQNGTVIREVTTDEGYDGYYFMGWMAPGDYQVRFSKDGVELKTENVSVTGFDVIEKLVDLPAPSQVTLKSITPNTDGSIQFNWNSLIRNKVGYRIYYSENDDLSDWKLVEDETDLTSTSSSLTVSPSAFSIPSTSNKLYFKIVGVNKDVNNEYSGPDEIIGDKSKVYSTYSSDSGVDILVVDGFDRKTGINGSNDHALSVVYNSKLSKDDKVQSVTTADNTAIIDGSVVMGDYDIVFWISGEESTADDTFGTAEQGKVKTYLENGGQFVVSGAEIGWDLVKKGTAADKAFYTDYLKAKFENDGSATVGNSIGVASTEFDGLSVAFNNANGWEVKYPDGISPVTGAEALMKYASGGFSSVIGYKGTFGSSTVKGGLVHLAFPIGAAVQTDVDILIEKSTKYLLGDAQLANEEYFSDNLTVYPNPVKGNVTISGFENNQEFELNVYSTSGTLIYRKAVKSNGGDLNINSSDWKKGVYFLEVRHDNSRVVKKLLKQ